MTKNKNNNQESPKNNTTENENEETEQLFDFEENIEDGEELPVTDNNPESNPIQEPAYTSILYPNQTPTTSQKSNTTSSKTITKYRVILVKSDSYILDINGTGAGPYQKTTSTQNIKIGDFIELPSPDEGE